MRIFSINQTVLKLFLFPWIHVSYYKIYFYRAKENVCVNMNKTSWLEKCTFVSNYFFTCMFIYVRWHFTIKGIVYYKEF